jgi:hypothetical protein
MKLNNNEFSYWIGFFMCLFLIGVSSEIIINTIKSVPNLELMKELANSLIYYSPIIMIAISLFGMFIVFQLNEKPKDE